MCSKGLLVQYQVRGLKDRNARLQRKRGGEDRVKQAFSSQQALVSELTEVEALLCTPSESKGACLYCACMVLPRRYVHCMHLKRQNISLLASSHEAVQEVI